jgi:hypothetical protein
VTRQQARTLTHGAHPSLRVTASGGRATVTRIAAVKR